jgi:hypothetical protein
VRLSGDGRQDAGQAAFRPDGEWLRALFGRAFARLPDRDKRSRGCVSFTGFFAHFKKIGSGASPIQIGDPHLESRPCGQQVRLFLSLKVEKTAANSRPKPASILSKDA